MSSSLWKGVVKAADRLSGKIPDSGPDLVSYMTRKDLETKPDGKKTWKSWNNYTLTQLARELAKESRYSKYQKKECYEMLIHRLLDFRFFAHMLKAIMVVEEELLLDFREAAYVLQLFKDSEIPPHIIEKEVQHPRFKERLQRKQSITLKDLIAHLQNVNYKIWVDDHQEDWGHAIRKRARRIYKYLDDPEELAIARAKAQGKPIPRRSKPKPQAKSQSKSKSSSKSSSKTSSQKKAKSKPRQKPQQKPAPPKQKKPAASSGQKKDDFDNFFGDSFGDNSNNNNNGGQAAKDDPSLGWLANLDTGNLQNMSGFDVETGNGNGGGVDFGFGDYDDEKNDENDDDMDDFGDDDMENMFDKLAKHTSVNILENQPKKPQNLKNTKGKTMSQMAQNQKHSDLNQAMAPSTDLNNIKDPFSNLNSGSDPFADMNNQMVAQQRAQQTQMNNAFGQFGNFNTTQQASGAGLGYGMRNNQGNSMNTMNSSMNAMNMNAPASPNDLFSANANANANPSSIFGQVNDPFANLSSQYSSQGNANVKPMSSYGNKGKPKDAFAGLGVLK